MNDRPTHDQSNSEFETFLAEASAMGMPEEIRPEDVGAQLPSAPEMLARAKEAEAAKAHPKGGPQVRSVLRRPGALIAAAAAAAVILGAFGVGLLGRETAVADTPPVLDFEFAKARDIAWAPGREARLQLMKLAAAAGKSSTLDKRGTTQHTVSENWFAEITAEAGHTAAVLRPVRRESWLHADGSVVVRETPGPALRPDGRYDLDAPAPGPIDPVLEGHSGSESYARAVEQLGTDPETVRAALLKAAQCPSNKPSATRAACLVGQITMLATDHVLPRGTLRAFWLMLADEPSLRDLGVVRDRAGRPGIGISLIAPDLAQFRRILIISPESGELLGNEEILIKADKTLDLKVPAIYQFTAIVSSRWTSDPGPLPTNKQ